MSSLTEHSLQPGEPSTATETPKATAKPQDSVPLPKRRRYCLTICTVRKPGISEDEFGEYLSKTHAQISKRLLAKYGMIRWTTSHNTTETRKVLPSIYGPDFKNVVTYDCFSQAIFEDLDRIISMTNDPYYDEFIKHDPENFADSENTKISIGWLEDHIMDGNVIEN